MTSTEAGGHTERAPAGPGPGGRLPGGEQILEAEGGTSRPAPGEVVGLGRGRWRRGPQCCAGGRQVSLVPWGWVAIWAGYWPVASHGPKPTLHTPCLTLGPGLCQRRAQTPSPAGGLSRSRQEGRKELGSRRALRPCAVAPAAWTDGGLRLHLGASSQATLGGSAAWASGPCPHSRPSPHKGHPLCSPGSRASCCPSSPLQSLI